MTDKITALGKPPVRLIAELDGVYVFQTQAFTADDNDLLAAKSEQLQKGQASYGEFNLGLHVNDASLPVLMNRMRLLSAINEQLSALSLNAQPSKVDSLHWVNQVHGKQVYDIDNSADDALHNVRLSMRPVNADAMISQQANMALAIVTADCVPIVLYQPATKQIAAIHAGWQGLAYGVIKATTERFDSSKPIIAWIGACISQANYEVGRQVLEKLLVGCTDNNLLDSITRNNFASLFSRSALMKTEMSDDSHLDNRINSSDLHKSIAKLSNRATISTDKISINRVKLNLPKLAAAQLEHLGVQIANDTAIDCSYEDIHYYSYRRQTHLQQPATGRMALVIVRGY